MEPKRDLYEVLGVGREADQNQIKDAFRELALRYHPDRNKEPEAEQKFKEIAAAYAVLSDPDKKRQYDLGGFEGVGDFSQEELFGGINFQEIFGDLGASLFGNIFEGPRMRPNRGMDVEVLVEVPLSKIISGGTEEISLSVLEKCNTCNGSGASPGTQPITCDQCHGSGRKIDTHLDKNIRIQNVTTCSKCHGKGTIIEKPCATCAGFGSIQKEKKLEVSIPKGIEEGTILRLPGFGREAPVPEGAPGDLLVVVVTKKDPQFHRSGSHLWTSINIPIFDAVLGTKIDIQTLKGKIIVDVPKGTQSQTNLKVQGKGLPKFNEDGFGDLYIVVDITIPTDLNAKEIKLYEELRNLSLEKSVKRGESYA